MLHSVNENSHEWAGQRDNVSLKNVRSCHKLGDSAAILMSCD